MQRSYSALLCLCSCGIVPGTQARKLQREQVAVVVAMERRPSPSDAPQGDWPCVIVGSGFTTQKRLRSPTPGILGPRPSLLMVAAKTPSQCTAHVSERTRDRAPLCVQGLSALLHTPPPTRMPKARE